MKTIAFLLVLLALSFTGLAQKGKLKSTPVAPPALAGLDSAAFEKKIKNLNESLKATKNNLEHADSMAFEAKKQLSEFKSKTSNIENLKKDLTDRESQIVANKAEIKRLNDLNLAQVGSLNNNQKIVDGISKQRDSARTASQTWAEQVAQLKEQLAQSKNQTVSLQQAEKERDGLLNYLFSSYHSDVQKAIAGADAAKPAPFAAFIQKGNEIKSKLPPTAQANMDADIHLLVTYEHFFASIAKAKRALNEPYNEQLVKSITAELQSFGDVEVRADLKSTADNYKTLLIQYCTTDKYCAQKLFDAATASFVNAVADAKTLLAEALDFPVDDYTYLKKEAADVKKLLDAGKAMTKEQQSRYNTRRLKPCNN